MSKFFSDSEVSKINNAVVGSPAPKLGDLLNERFQNVKFSVGTISGGNYPVTVSTGAKKRLVRYWLSLTSGGAPYGSFGADIAIGSKGVVVTADSEAMTDANGDLILNVLTNNSQNATIYLVVSVDGVISSSNALADT